MGEWVPPDWQNDPEVDPARSETGEPRSSRTTKYAVVSKPEYIFNIIFAVFCGVCVGFAIGIVVAIVMYGRFP